MDPTARPPQLSDFLFELDPVLEKELELEPGYRTERLAAIVLWIRSHRERSITRRGRTEKFDSVDELRDVFVPTEITKSHGMASFEPRFEEQVAHVPYDFLECKDLRPVAESSAYRGAMRTVDPSFHGWLFKDTIELAIAGMRGFLAFRGKELSRAIRAYAWPFLWLTYPGRPESVVVMPNPLGQLAIIRSED